MIEIRGVRLVAAPGASHAAGDRPQTRWDVLVDGPTIARVRPAGGATEGDGAHDVIEGGGRLLLPGLVDAHVHGEAAIFRPEVQHALLRQGVTSVVVGQDGVSYAPTAPGAAADSSFAWATGYFTAINGAHPQFTGGSVAQLLATYDGATPLNVAYLAPHGTLRHTVTGAQRRPLDAAERGLLVRRLEQALDDGACGMSTGLEYVPGRFADEDELVPLARVLARHGLPHVSHMRGYQDRALGAFDELLRLARSTGVATHVSHLHGPAQPLAAALDAARTELDVTFDSYPYLRGSSILSMLTMADWVPIADVDAALAMLADPAVRRRLRDEQLAPLEPLWDRVTLAAVPGPLQATEGLTVREAAAELGLDPADAVLELLVASRLRVGCVFEQQPSHTDEQVRALLRHDAHLGGSDAIYAGGRPHPRGWGAFARFLGVHVRDLGDWTWAQAVQHLSTGTARRFGLGRRGEVREGWVADLALVDPDRVADHATYADPRRLAVGVDDVLVAGVPVLRDGELTDRRPGRALRPTEER
ncbi:MULTISPECIES: amidohydrolase family protein [unclassified Actinotalea]|uniref:N-acyl-D-amino-acid deacylase family protein n=1 Tax=unclassified Actinotalea TaxID=2638618 RepID=UPI0015F65C55|nr:MULTISPECIES: amidohydrolase family protein [unclassified Actinotalea]